MNIFRLVGDLSHLLAIIILIAKIWRTRSCAGIKNDTIELISYLPSKPEEAHIHRAFRLLCIS